MSLVTSGAFFAIHKGVLLNSFLSDQAIIDLER